MIKCTYCGKFISYSDLDSGKAKYIFTPDSEFECEEVIFLCRVCTLKEYGEKIMTGWQDKYKDLAVGQSAWYWHKDEKGPKGYIWYPIKVSRKTSMQDGQIVIVARGLYHRRGVVSEDFPNGPKCLTPDDGIALTEEVLSINRVLEGDNKEILIDSLCEEFGITEGKMRRAVDSANKKIKRRRNEC